jgi:hypothetical protein
VITGHGDLKQVLPGLSAGELVPVITGVMLNAVVRVTLALHEVIEFRRLSKRPSTPGNVLPLRRRVPAPRYPSKPQPADPAHNWSRPD